MPSKQDVDQDLKKSESYQDRIRMIALSIFIGLTETVKLADSWPKDGPRLLWKREGIPGFREGGSGCVPVANGRLYLRQDDGVACYDLTAMSP